MVEKLCKIQFDDIEMISKEVVAEEDLQKGMEEVYRACLDNGDTLFTTKYTDGTVVCARWLLEGPCIQVDASWFEKLRNSFNRPRQIKEFALRGVKPAAVIHPIESRELYKNCGAENLPCCACFPL